jgi:Kef-type K+ transport system membrane component KefB
MPILIIIILAAAILSGSLGGVLEVAAGVVLGLVLFVVGIAVAGWWYVRRKVRTVGRELDRFRGTRYPRERYPDDRSS